MTRGSESDWSPRPRPPVPRGPYLVVGLARSGQAAALLLAGRCEEVLGCDSAVARAVAGFGRRASKCILHADGVELLDRVRVLAKSPGVPQEAPVVAAARERGIPVLGELELAWRLLPNRLRRRHRDERQDDGHRDDRARLAHRRRARRGRRQRRHRRSPRWSARSIPEATVVCECSSFQLEDAEAFAPECAVFLNVAPDHLDRHRDLATTCAPSCGSSPTRTPTTSRSSTPRTRPSGAATSAGARAGSPIAAGPTRDCAVSLTDGVILVGLGAAHGGRRARAARPAQRRQRDGRGRRGAAIGIDARRSAEGLASFAASPHRIERVAEIGGVTYVNDSKATNPAAAAAAIELLRRRRPRHPRRHR